LIHRPKPGLDQATPSGNGVAAYALQRLGHLLGEARYLAAAERALGAFYPGIAAQPAGYATLLLALRENLGAPDIIVVRGPATEMGEWRGRLNTMYLPHALALFVPNGMSDLPAALAKPETPGVSAWVCQGVNCLPSVATPEALLKLVAASPSDSGTPA